VSAVHIGERIKNLRNKRNLTQEQLGKYLNVGKSTISQYENNINTPDITTLIKIANYFNTSVEYLLGRIDDPRPLNEIINNSTSSELEEIFEGTLKIDGKIITDEDKQSLLNFIKLAWKEIYKKNK
jgi:transcriptional regulator with XRE-family HTH domain